MALSFWLRRNLQHATSQLSLYTLHHFFFMNYDWESKRQALNLTQVKGNWVTSREVRWRKGYGNGTISGTLKQKSRCCASHDRDRDIGRFWEEGVGRNRVLSWPEPMQIRKNFLETDNQILQHLRWVHKSTFESLLTEPSQLRVWSHYKGSPPCQEYCCLPTPPDFKTILWTPYQHLHPSTICLRKMLLILFLNSIAVLYISRSCLDRSAGGLLCLPR